MGGDASWGIEGGWDALEGHGWTTGHGSGAWGRSQCVEARGWALGWSVRHGRGVGGPWRVVWGSLVGAGRRGGGGWAVGARLWGVEGGWDARGGARRGGGGRAHP